MKLMAMYLPQYHSFPENDAWWGKGYTEWTAVKRAKPLFKGHIQPRVPLDGRYYDLVKDGAATWAWQADIANRYGIYGFSVYQYYFTGKKLMEQPLEILLSHPEIDIRYNICWANESWTRAWYDLKEEVLMKQEYGGEKEWAEHFDYLMKFFCDPRYIKVGNRPVLQIYRTTDISCLKEMADYFNRRAKAAGFEGVFLIGGNTAGELETRHDILDGYYDFEPGYTLKHDMKKRHVLAYNISTGVRHTANLILRGHILERRIPIEHIYTPITGRKYADNEFPGIIARWDNTPRRSYKGLVYTGASPEKFGMVLDVLKSKVEGREVDFVYINAWNEWGEGAMLEPEETEKYAYLEETARYDK